MAMLSNCVCFVSSYIVSCFDGRKKEGKRERERQIWEGSHTERKCVMVLGSLFYIGGSGDVKGCIRDLQQECYQSIF